MVPQMYHWHALPDGWAKMEYRAFLERRRELMAEMIREGYETLRGIEEEDRSHMPLPVSAMVRQGEGKTIEFKGALRTSLHTMQKDPRIEFTAIRTIAGFLNGDGGTLILGVLDNGDPVGYEADRFENKDKMLLHLDNLVKDRLKPQFVMYIHPRFEQYRGYEVLAVECLPAKSPVFMKDGKTERFFIRAGASTAELNMSEAQEYIKQRFHV
jgi:predicted HTH transcriptional regulator